MATASERVMQRAVRAVARTTLRRGTSPEIDNASLRRVLVVRPDDRAGNVLLTTPLLRALREGLPHVRIDWLVAPKRRVLVDGLFLADRLVPYDRRALARNPVALSAFVSSLRAQKYDAVIDATHFHTFSLTGAMLTRLTGAPIRIGHERGDSAHFYTHPVPVPETTRYDVAAKLTLLSPLGLASRGIELETVAGWGPQHDARAKDLLSELKLEPRRFVLLNPGARKPDRRFSAEGYARIAKRLAGASGLRVVVVWGPGEEALAQELVDQAKPGAVLAPPTDLHELAALMRRAALVITNDTGPMHLAVACHAPTLALFTVDEADRWGHPLETFRAVDATRGENEVVEAAIRAASELTKKPEKKGR